jgi:hypothetical protein
MFHRNNAKLLTDKLLVCSRSSSLGILNPLWQAFKCWIRVTMNLYRSFLYLEADVQTHKKHQYKNIASPGVERKFELNCIPCKLIVYKNLTETENKDF